MLWGQGGPLPVKAPAENERGTGDLSILPARVVLEGRERSTEVMLKNIGHGHAIYRIYFCEMDMDENGELKERPRKEGELSAADLIRYSPRQVELAPGEVQTVRIQVRKPEGLADGEYRSHLMFQNVPAAEAAAPLEDDAEKRLSFKITTVMAISIPVIVRHGVVSGSVSFSDFRFWRPQQIDAAPVLSFHMNRTGNRSLTGDFAASVESGGTLKKGTVLYDRKNVVIYHNVPFRNVHLPMWQATNGSLKGARIKVTFTPSDFKSTPVTAYFDLPS